MTELVEHDFIILFTSDFFVGVSFFGIFNFFMILTDVGWSFG
jgi:hypothetical protein